MTQQTLCNVVDSGRALIAQYLAGLATFEISHYAIGSGNVGNAPKSSDTDVYSPLEIAGSKLTAIPPGDKTNPSASIAQISLVLPDDYDAGVSSITEVGLYYSVSGVWATDRILVAYGTFEGIPKKAGDELTLKVRIQI